jgi:hypothetical protein
MRRFEYFVKPYFFSSFPRHTLHWHASFCEGANYSKGGRVWQG